MSEKLQNGNEQINEFHIRRLFGSDRIGTAYSINQEREELIMGGGLTYSPVGFGADWGYSIVSSNHDFADALTAALFIAQIRGPKDFMNNYGSMYGYYPFMPYSKEFAQYERTSFVIGGYNAVPSPEYENLKELDTSERRITGPNRFALQWRLQNCIPQKLAKRPIGLY